MTEERRFIRGIIPGLIFLVELGIVLLLVLCKSQIEDIVEKISSGIGTPIIIFLASGGIGYFLGIIYRSVYWSVPQSGFSNILKRFLTLEILDLDVGNRKIVSFDNYKINGAWRIINEIFWLCPKVTGKH